MKKVLVSFSTFCFAMLVFQKSTHGQTVVKRGVKYDTLIRRHVDKPAIKPAGKLAVKEEIVIPAPEFINQPYYYDKDDNKLIKLEDASAQMITRKKTLGLKGARQSLAVDAVSSKIRFLAKKDIVFIMKTSADVIDIMSYIKLYQFTPADQKREVIINSKEGILNDKEETKGKLIPFSVKMNATNNYTIQFADQLGAGEYGFVWVKNMELKAFTVFAFGIDWKSSN
jgi:hypothetical protein